MTAQGSLFDPTPIEAHLPARATDPETSRAAALDLQRRLKERKREVLAGMGTLNRPATAEEIRAEMVRAHSCIREIGTVRSRLSQLEDDGLVHKAGVQQIPREEGGSGRPAILWALGPRR